MTDTTTSAPELPIDVVHGPRPAATCATCRQPLPAEPRPVIEAAFDGSDEPICGACLETIHPGVHAAVALLRVLAASMGTADGRRIAREALDAVAAGVELLSEDAGRPMRLAPRPQRAQPRRSTRHNRRR